MISNMKPFFRLGEKKMNSHISHKVRVQFLDTPMGCLHSCPSLRKKKMLIKLKLPPNYWATCHTRIFFFLPRHDYNFTHALMFLVSPSLDINAAFRTCSERGWTDEEGVKRCGDELWSPEADGQGLWSSFGRRNRRMDGRQPLLVVVSVHMSQWEDGG